MRALREIHQLTRGRPSRFGAGVMGIPVLLSSLGTTADDAIFDNNAPPFRIIECWGVMTAAGDTDDAFAVTNGSDTIVSSVDVSAAGDKDILRGAEIDMPLNTVSLGGSLIVTRASDAPVDVYLLAHLVEQE